MINIGFLQKWAKNAELDTDQGSEKTKGLQLCSTIGKYGLPTTFLVGCVVYLLVGLWNVNT
jgi:hypothetical protein